MNKPDDVSSVDLDNDPQSAGGPPMPDIDLIILISKWQREYADRIGITLPSVMERRNG